MILVVLGTHPQPMNRLLAHLDEMVDAGHIHEPVIVQAAVYDYAPRRLETLGILPHAALVELIRAAEVVVSHAGPGSLATIRMEGRVPVVVPRSPRQAEHVDGHQERYAARLRGQPGYIVPADLNQLASAIELARRASITTTPPDVSRAVHALRELAGE